MLPPPLPLGKTARFRAPPWHDRHPDRLRLDVRLAPDHLARRIDRLVDALDLAELRQAYAGSGSDPYPPELLLKAVLFECQRGVHAPARWHTDAHESEPLRWLLRGCEPARSRWYAFRDRLAPEYLQRLNAQVSTQARQLDLSAGHRAAQDGTNCAANSSRHRLLSAATVRERLRLLEPACAADERGEAVGDRPAWMARQRNRARQLRLYQRALARLEQRQHQELQKRACDRQPPERARLNPSDLDAVPGLDKFKVYRPLYNVQLLDDLDSPLILAYDVFAQASDAGTLPPLLARAREQGWQLRVLLCDSGYVSGPHLAAAAKEEVVVYAPWPQPAPGETSAKPPAWLPREEFVYLAGPDCYVCPRGGRLELQTVRTQQRAGGEKVRVAVYRCPGEQCRECPLAAWCVPNPQAGRTIYRSEHEGLFAALRQRLAGAEGQQLYRLRKQTVELGFADLKENRQVRRLAGRGLARAQAQVGLCVLAHNGLEVDKARQAARAGPTAAAS
jgi:transposase